MGPDKEATTQRKADSSQDISALNSEFVGGVRRAQRLWALAAPAQDLGLVPTAHMVAYTYLQLSF